jgi:chromosome segregation ATPase
MSGGQSFAPIDSNQLTPEERLSALEQRLPVLIERLQRYDKLLDESEQLRQRCESLESSIGKLANLNESNQKAIADNFQRHEKRHAELDSTVRSQGYQIYAHDKQFSDIKLDQNTYLDVINDLRLDGKVRHENLLALTAPKEDFDHLCVTVSAHADSFVNSLKDQRRKHEELSFQVKVNNEDIKKFEERVEVLVDSIKEHCQMMDTQLRAANEGQVKVGQIIQDKLDAADARLNKNVKDYISGFFNTLETPEKIRDELSHQLQQVSLDGSNAVLRATNCEKHMTILERKIENIYLLLKKHELSQ